LSLSSVDAREGSEAMLPPGPRSGCVWELRERGEAFKRSARRPTAATTLYQMVYCRRMCKIRSVVLACTCVRA
jgi:hypothetical protein